MQDLEIKFDLKKRNKLIILFSKIDLFDQKWPLINVYLFQIKAVHWTLSNFNQRKDVSRFPQKY